MENNFLDIRCTDQTEGRTRLRISTSSPSFIGGSIRGPYCKYSRTLPATFPIHQGEAVIVDPCYWNPQLPFRYEVTLNVQCENGSCEEKCFLWGLRWCLPHRNDLRLHGKRFVVRGIASHPERIDLVECRQLASAVCVRDLDEAFLEDASELGVMVIMDAARLTVEQLPKVALHAAVHFVKDAPQLSGSDVLQVTGTPRRGAVHWLDESDVTDQVSSSHVQFVARRMQVMSPTDLRRGCDALQRDLAEFGQFAGYIAQAET